MNGWVKPFDKIYVDLVFRKNVTTFAGLLRYLEDEVLASATSFDNTVYLFWFIVLAMAFMLFLSFYLMSKPFGYPGGPRKRVSRRKPKFLNEKKLFLKHLSKKKGSWKFVEVEDQAKRLPEKGLLTGEIYGRHRWEYVYGDGNSDRAISFNPATNPNSADLIFRTQQLSRHDGQVGGENGE